MDTILEIADSKNKDLIVLVSQLGLYLINGRSSLLKECNNIEII